MEYTLFTETMDELKQAALKHPAVLVGFSGGKDSWCVLDLCVRTFDRVVCFFMYFVPGLKCVEDELARAQEKYGVEILQYPHWLVFRALKEGLFCDTTHKLSGLYEPKVNDISMAVMADTGIRLVAHGAKEADSMWRRRYFTICFDFFFEGLQDKIAQADPAINGRMFGGIP